MGTFSSSIPERGLVFSLGFLEFSLLKSAFSRVRKMSVDFYYIPYSSPCRAVQLTADFLDIKLNKKFVNLATREHLKPEYAKINPRKTVPCLVHGDLVLSESRAQLCYLANQFAPDHSIYPSDPKKRALVDNELYYDATSLYSAFVSLVYAILKEDSADINPALIKKAEHHLEQLNDDLAKSKYVAGNNDHLSLADISLLCTYKSIECTQFWDLSKYTNIHKWVELMRGQLKNYDTELEQPNTQYGVFIREKLAANRAAKASTG